MTGDADKITPKIVNPIKSPATDTAVLTFLETSYGRSSSGRVLRNLMYAMNKSTYGKSAVKAVMVTNTL